MGPVRVEVHSFVQNTSKRALIIFLGTVFFTTYGIIIIVRVIDYLVSKIHSIHCRLKINDVTEVWNMLSLLGPI